MARKFKIGDKVRIVNVRSITNIPEGQNYIGKETVIKEYISTYGYQLDGVPYVWFDNELEAIESEVGLFEKITKSIVQAAKTAPIIVEQTEDGGIKISPLCEMPKPRKSGIYYNEESNNTYVVFGGGIHVAVGENIEGQVIAFQQLNEIIECGETHNEEWVKGKPTVNLVINNNNTIKILRDALNYVENKINKKD